ncbi:MAG: hypothetical protein J6A09_00115 [Alphaproteobacteria bacterium]|nr:hypothetical protein [Alphaproteobacteria bacterium]
MFGRFFYGQCSLREAFWKFSILGLLVTGALARLSMILLKQTANYDPRFFRILLNNLSILNMNTTVVIWLCLYITTFLALVAYSFLCIGGMWNTYKEYEKSKILAFICLFLVCITAYFAIKASIY